MMRPRGSRFKYKLIRPTRTDPRLYGVYFSGYLDGEVVKDAWLGNIVLAETYHNRGTITLRGWKIVKDWRGKDPEAYETTRSYPVRADAASTLLAARLA